MGSQRRCVSYSDLRLQTSVSLPIPHEQAYMISIFTFHFYLLTSESPVHFSLFTFPF